MIALLQHEVGARPRRRRTRSCRISRVIDSRNFWPKRGRAVVVHAHHHVALRGEHVVVPAEVEVVAPRRVRPAVDVVQQRPLLLRVEVGRVDRPTSAPARRSSRGCSAPRPRPSCNLRHALVVERLDARARWPSASSANTAGRRAHGVAHERDRVARHVEVAHRAALRDDLGRFAPSGKRNRLVRAPSSAWKTSASLVRGPRERRRRCCGPSAAADHVHACLARGR